LSFIPLPPRLQGFHCSFEKKREIVISERELVPFAHVHTLFHEFREMLEHVFVERGHGTLNSKQSLEAKAEEFAMVARMATATKSSANVTYVHDVRSSAAVTKTGITAFQDPSLTRAVTVNTPTRKT
jgi:hypothetical protein